MMRRLLAVLFLVHSGCVSAPARPTAPVPTAPKPVAFEVMAVDGLGLFGDERAQSQDVVAEWARARGDTPIVPPEATRKAWALAAEGKNPLTGALCGTPLTQEQARRRWAHELGAEGLVISQLHCTQDGGCALAVDAQVADAPRWSLEGPLPAKGDSLTSLKAALGGLVPTPNRPALVHSGNHAFEHPLDIQDADLISVAVQPADERDEIPMGKKASAPNFTDLSVENVDRCIAPASHASVLFEVLSDGKVGRCEARANTPTTSAMATCLCPLLGKSVPQTAPWLRAHRWHLGLDVDRRHITTPDRRFVVFANWVSDPERLKVPLADASLHGWKPGHGRMLASCFALGVVAAGHLTARWTVTFDGAGKPTNAVEQAGFAPPLDRKVATCVQGLLMHAQTPCPAKPGLSAVTDVTADVRQVAP